MAIKNLSTRKKKKKAINTGLKKSTKKTNKKSDKKVRKVDKILQNQGTIDTNIDSSKKSDDVAVVKNDSGVSTSTDKKSRSVSNGDIEIAVVISNTRVPHHDNKAIDLCIDHAKDLGAHKVIFDGDIIDFHRRSEIDRNPLRMLNDREMLAKRRSVEDRIRSDEMAKANVDKDNDNDTEEKPKKIRKLTESQIQKTIEFEVLEESLRREIQQLFEIMLRFKKELSKSEFIWVYGCQEHYLVSYLGKYFPNLVDEINQFCKKEDIQQIYNGTRNNVYMYGQLAIGHWLRGGLNSPSGYVAHALMDEEGVSLIQGHTNRGGWACRTVEGRKNMSAFENFSLCKRPLGKNWQLGYSVVYKEKDNKRFQVFQVPVANYGFFWGDKEYRQDKTRIGTWEKAVAISDIHRPWEDEAVLDVVFDFIKDYGPEVIFVNGDATDFPDISRFSNSPLDILTPEDLKDVGSLVVKDSSGTTFIKPRLQREFEKIYAFFKRLRSIAPNARIVWVFGNHEYRLQRYVEENASHLAGVCKPGDKEEILSLGTVTKVKDLNIEIIYSGQVQSYTTYGDLLVGHFYAVSNKSPYTARKLLQQKHMSLLQPHVHRMGTHYKTDLDGTLYVAVEMGCLCRLDPLYMQNPNWQHGFAVIHKKKNSKRFYLQPIHIIEGAFLFGGKRYGN